MSSLLAALTAPFLSISEQPLSREVISYFPQEMSHVEEAYKEFRESLDSSLNTYDLLQSVCHFIRYQIFDLSLCKESSVRSMVQQRPMVTLDEFVAQKTGVCRHFVLVTDYFLERLIEENLLVGQCDRIRQVIPGRGKHAWNVFYSSDQSFLIDSFWGIVENSSKNINE